MSGAGFPINGDLYIAGGIDSFQYRGGPVFVRIQVGVYTLFHPVNVLVAFGSNPSLGSTFM